MAAVWKTAKTEALFFLLYLRVFRASVVTSSLRALRRFLSVAGEGKHRGSLLSFFSFQEETTSRFHCATLRPTVTPEFYNN